MKKSILLLLLSLVACIGWAQEVIKEKQVPADILTDFRLRFHEAEEVLWIKQGETHYGARFLVRDMRAECVYDNTSQWVQSQQEITFRELPDSAKAHLQGNYADYKANQITKVTTRRYGVLYDAHISNGLKHYLITFDMDGDLVDTKEEELKEKQLEEQQQGEKKKGLSFPKLGGS